MSTAADARAAGELAEQIKPLLAGRGGAIQGAALAELLAIWLAGHRVLGDPAGQARLREELLTMHIESVRALVAAADLAIDRKWKRKRQ